MTKLSIVKPKTKKFFWRVDAVIFWRVDAVTLGKKVH